MQHEARQLLLFAFNNRFNRRQRAEPLNAEEREANVYTSAGLFARFGWLLFGEFAWQLKERSSNATAQLFLTQFGASNFFVGLMIGSVPSALGMLLAPIVSVRSDRHRGRWGRRIPFLLIPMPFVMASMTGLALFPPDRRTLTFVAGPGIHGA